MKRWLVSMLIFSMILMLCSCGTPVYEAGTVTKENADSYLEKFRISTETSKLVKGDISNYKVAGEASYETNMFMFELPDISNYALDVAGEGEIDVEVFVPLENNGGSIRELVSYTANAFNSENKVLEDGRTISISVRSLESSLAEEYILNGVYYPKGYIAANELYGILMQENGIDVSMVQNKTFGNTMGVVVEKTKYDEVANKYGELTISTLVEANEVGDISVGYTNPTNNPTGLNFVISMLSYFDASNPASIEATTDFSNFQNTISSVSYSTEQMKKAVENGVIDAFVIERQAYENDESIKNGFVFIPFGVRHDNPLYSVGTLSNEEYKVLQMFGEYILSSNIQQYASSLGYNKDESYLSTVANYSGGMITEILDFWKQEKASGKKIAAVFVADVSGSMSGGKLEALQDSLKNAMQYVGENNKVGLLSYDGTVYIDLPIADFTTEQQEYFIGAIDSWKSGGGTATNNALLVAIKLLNEEMALDSNIKPIIILLSDGYTESGYSLNSMEELIDVYDIPIYTIGYEANVKELERIANINQGAFINATSDDVGYVLKTLFDAEL